MSSQAASPGVPAEPALPGEVTQWLAALSQSSGSSARSPRAEKVDGTADAAATDAGTAAGRAEAQARLVVLLWGDLHRLARAQMRHEVEGHTLSPTALVNEAWLRLAQQHRTAWANRGHFLAIAATMMRRVLVDHVVAQRAAKREAAIVPLDTAVLQSAPAAGPGADALAVHEALLAFEALDARAAKVVELKFFGGLEIEEIAEVLAISPATVKRDWTAARAWLRRELTEAAP